MRYAMYNSGRTKAPQGITLIEVMMSAMVVSLGIMGLVALIPLGTHLTERGTRADRVASIGERAYHEAKIRSYLHPRMWVAPEGAGVAIEAGLNVPPFMLPGQNLPIRQPYLIDPWFFPDGDAGTTRRFFPASTQLTFNGPAIPNDNGKLMQMHRLSVRPLMDSTVNVKSPRRQLATTFASQDDLSFERPSDGNRPPFQTFFTRGDNVPVRRQSQLDYTWMYMLVPDLRPLAINGLTPGEIQSLSPPIRSGGTTGAVRTRLGGNLTDEYNLSVIVMQRRQPLVPQVGEMGAMTQGRHRSERVLEIPPGAFLGTDGYSTGEVGLRVSNNGATPDDIEQMLRLTSGDWICLAGPVSVPPNIPAGHVYQWYRVSSVSDIFDTDNESNPTPLTSAHPGVFVTFTGPDWSADSPPTHAIIVEGVVGVYTKRVRLDLSTY